MWGNLISNMNHKAILNDHRESYEYYRDKLRKHWKNRHDKEWRPLIRDFIEQSKHYRHMVIQVSELGDLEDWT